MPVPSYGAAPLAKFFLVCRALQLIAFIAIVGITANFVSQIVTTGAHAPREVVGTLTIASLATLYCLISVPFFWAQASLGLLMMAALDFLLMIAFIVVAVVLGKPLSYLDCRIIGKSSAAVDAASAFDFTQSIGNNLNKYGNFVGWSGATRANCYECKAIWGMSIGLCILFASTLLILPSLYFKQKKYASTKSAV